MSLGNNIKQFRKELGITQEELATRLFVTSQAVSKWESGAGLPDTAQIVPLAKALNSTPDALFGFNSTEYDSEYANKVCFEANQIRDQKDVSKGSVEAVDFLETKCQENLFNYGILTRYVQAVAHMSRFVDCAGLFAGEEDNAKWISYVKTAEFRAQQVIRYSGDKELAEKCHYALCWIYWHDKDYDKGLEHLGALPSISSNMLRETISSYYAYVEDGMDALRDSVRENYQNFVRAINKQFVYSAEQFMWEGTLEEVEANCHWALSVMDKFMENEKMRAYCQGFYRDTAKYLIAAYLRNNMPEKAAAEWKSLVQKIDDYVVFCNKVNTREKSQLLKDFGEKGTENMLHYNREFADSKIAFMLSQLKSWCDGEVFARFKSLIQ